MPKGKQVGQGGPWPAKRRYAVAVNTQRLKGEFRPRRYKGKKGKSRKSRKG